MSPNDSYVQTKNYSGTHGTTGAANRARGRLCKST
jgi:hypothetical protein